MYATQHTGSIHLYNWPQARTIMFLETVFMCQQLNNTIAATCQFHFHFHDGEVWSNSEHGRGLLAASKRVMPNCNN